MAAPKSSIVAAQESAQKSEAADEHKVVVRSGDILSHTFKVLAAEFQEKMATDTHGLVEEVRG
jgi:hypothetical protein